MEFRLLGSLDVAERDRSLPLGGSKQRALLADLLLHANAVVPVERLIDDLWGASPPATVAKSVQVYVSRLRKQLGDGRLVTRPPGYVLRVDPSELDVARFEALVTRARGAEPEVAAARLREALALWRGPPLADLAYEPFAQAEIARLEELRLAALEQRIDAELAPGRHAELVGELEALAAEHPLRERLRGAAHARPLPVGPPGGGARGLPPDARVRWSTSWASSRAGGCRSSSGRSSRRTPSLDAGPRAARRRPRRRWRGVRGPRGRAAALEAGLDDGARGARAASCCSPASRGSARAGSPRSSPGPRTGAAPASSSAAAGRPAARRRTGRGCRRSAPTCATTSPTRCGRSSGRARTTSPSCCRSCASSSPTCASPRRPTTRARASACSRP